VARLLDRAGQVLHVVDGADLRHEVRRLFDLDDLSAAHRVPSAVLHHLHRIEHLEAANAVVAEIVALRWRHATPGARRAPHAYLRRPATGAGRLVVAGDRATRGVVAGPMPRDTARRAVAELAAADLVEQVWFFDALREHAGAAPGRAPAGAMAEVVAWQRTIDRGRACTGEIEVGGACVSVDRGRVRDVVADGRSWADVLPPHDADDPHLPLTPEAAAEAAWVARRMQPLPQPGCEILDSWSPQ
jgi:hypothetical protein